MTGRDAYNRRGRGRWQPNDRQRLVLELLVDGKTYAQIADHFQVSLDGAKWHDGELLVAVYLPAFLGNQEREGDGCDRVRPPPTEQGVGDEAYKRDHR